MVSTITSQSVQLGDRFSAFNISTHAYKVVEEHPILVDVSIPKSLAGGHKTKAPLSSGYMVEDLYVTHIHQEQ